MNEIVNFLKYLHEVKFLSFPRIILYDDLSGHIEYESADHAYGLIEDVELFDFYSLEDLLIKIDEYKNEI